MRAMRVLRILAAGLTATVLATGLSPGPAMAETATFKDERGDAPDRVDIRRVKVKHTTRNVKVVVKFVNLRKKDASLHDLAVWFATEPGTRPQYLVGASAYHLYFGETKGWRLKQQKKHPYGNIDCESGYRYQPAKDRIVFRFPRTCLDSPDRIRVAVSSGLVDHKDGEPFSLGPDELVDEKHLTAWVRSSE